MPQQRLFWDGPARFPQGCFSCHGHWGCALPVGRRTATDHFPQVNKQVMVTIILTWLIHYFNGTPINIAINNLLITIRPWYLAHISTWFCQALHALRPTVVSNWMRWLWTSSLTAAVGTETSGISAARILDPSCKMCYSKTLSPSWVSEPPTRKLAWNLVFKMIWPGH